MVDQAIAEFQNDDPLAFAFFNKYDITGEDGRLPQNEGSDHMGNTTMEEKPAFQSPRQERKLSAREAYEKKNGAGEYDKLSDTNPEKWGDFNSEYNKNPEVEIKEAINKPASFGAKIIIDFERIKERNSRDPQGTLGALMNNKQPGKTLKHELGHFLYFLGHSQSYSGSRSESAAKKYENTYDGDPKTTATPSAR